MLVWWLACGVALASPPLVDAGRAASRVAEPDGADVVVLVGAEEGGSLEPCGCGPRPRGGAARVASYVAAVREAEPALLVNAGGWLAGAVGADGGFTADVAALNDGMIASLPEVGWTALNAGWRDLRYLGALDALPPGVVSANARRVDGGPALPAVIEVDVDGVAVAITGVTGGRYAPDGWALDEPVGAARAAVAAVDADLVVVLAFEVGDALRELADVPGVDLVIDADQYGARWPVTPLGDALWARAVPGTEVLGELRVHLQADGAVDVTERHVAMDPSVGDDRAVRKLARRVQDEVDRAYEAVYGSR